MTEEELKYIERLTEAASAGPWMTTPFGTGENDVPNEDGEDIDGVLFGQAGNLDDYHLGWAGHAEDGKFIVKARTFAPLLVAEVRRLQEMVLTLEAKVNEAELRGQEVGFKLASRAK